jgi:hypothetical protein
MSFFGTTLRDARFGESQDCSSLQGTTYGATPDEAAQSLGEVVLFSTVVAQINAATG